jgi:hypothetical protein
MTGSEAAEGDGREETSKERLDRNFEELTGELRVVITGVQVLFAFPFATLWFAMPLLRRRKLDGDGAGGPPEEQPR